MAERTLSLSPFLECFQSEAGGWTRGWFFYYGRSFSHCVNPPFFVRLETSFLLGNPNSYGIDSVCPVSISRRFTFFVNLNDSWTPIAGLQLDGYSPVPLLSFGLSVRVLGFASSVRVSSSEPARSCSPKQRTFIYNVQVHQVHACITSMHA